jgi:glycerophosphoryl diester phosphodiesterase
MKLWFLPVIALTAGCICGPQIDYDTLIAHRGESIDAPENTLPAFKLAVDRGFGFECDIYLSADKRCFTFHDSSLTRTTGGKSTKKCSEANWDSEISTLDVGSWGKWKDSKYAGTSPALLEDVLKLARDGRYIYVEIKAGVKIVPYIKEVFAKQKNATPKNVLFICFSGKVCSELKKQMPEYKVYWLVSSTRTVEKGKREPVDADYVIDNLKMLGVDGVDINFNPKYQDKAFFDKIKAAGFETHVWTVNKYDTAKKAFELGAQTLTTDCAKRLYDTHHSAK